MKAKFFIGISVTFLCSSIAAASPQSAQSTPIEINKKIHSVENA